MDSDPLPTAWAVPPKFRPDSIYLIAYHSEDKGLSIRVVRYHGPDSWTDLGVGMDKNHRGFIEDNVLVFQEIDSSEISVNVSRFYTGKEARYYKEVHSSGKPAPKPLKASLIRKSVDLGFDCDPEDL